MQSAIAPAQNTNVSCSKQLKTYFQQSWGMLFPASTGDALCKYKNNSGRVIEFYCR